MAGTLVDLIVEIRVRDDARNGNNLEENQRRRMQTAQGTMNSKKRVPRQDFCLLREAFALVDLKY